MEKRHYAYWILAAVCGSIVRLVFGVHHQLWDCAPDQLAWQAVLDDAALHGVDHYHQLIHYPHEGGSVVLSLLALLFKPLGPLLPPLSWVALLVDTLSRFMQISIAQRLFGFRTAAWFAGWTVLGVPLLLPWATVNFGMHALVAFAPFALAGLAVKMDARPWKIGLLTGLLLSVSYNVIVFVPAFMVWWSLKRDTATERLKGMALFLGAVLLGVLPHFIARATFDSAFHIDTMSAVSVRGLDWSSTAVADMPSLAWRTLHTSLPASLLLASLDQVSARALAWFVLGFIVLGVAGLCLRRKEDFRSSGLLLLTALFFCIAYATGPLFTDRVDITTPVLYRHFAFIAPVLSLLIIHGFVRHGRAGMVLAGLWLMLCGAASVEHMNDQRSCGTAMHRAAGWVLARKYGHDAQALERIASSAPPEHRHEIVIGYGWGLAAALLEDKNADDTEAVRKLDETLDLFDQSSRSLLDEGVQHAFAPGVTPVLDAGLQERVKTWP